MPRIHDGVMPTTQQIAEYLQDCGCSSCLSMARQNTERSVRIEQNTRLWGPLSEEQKHAVADRLSDPKTNDDYRLLARSARAFPLGVHASVFETAMWGGYAKEVPDNFLCVLGAAVWRARNYQRYLLDFENMIAVPAYLALRVLPGRHFELHSLIVEGDLAELVYFRASTVRKCDTCRKYFYENNGGWLSARHDEWSCTDCVDDHNQNCVSWGEELVLPMDDQSQWRRRESCFEHSDGELYTYPSEDEEEDISTFEYSTDILDILDSKNLENTPKGLFFGVELEMESNNGMPLLSEALGGRKQDRFILKYDGSLDDGVEVVTLPLTLEEHLSQVMPWEKTLDAAIRAGAMSGRNTPNCGMHVHINRAAMSQLTLGKLLVFMNSEENRIFLRVIAQRSSERWARFAEKKASDGARYKVNESRYEAVNVSERTAEVRIFRGNLRAERIYKNIEFCHALVRYCESHGLSQLTWDAFCAWVFLPGQHKTYIHLNRYLADKGYAVNKTRAGAAGAMLTIADESQEA